jgi:hypothetical protein
MCSLVQHLGLLVEHMAAAMKQSADEQQKKQTLSRTLQVAPIYSITSCL